MMDQLLIAATGIALDAVVSSVLPTTIFSVVTVAAVATVATVSTSVLIGGDAAAAAGPVVTSSAVTIAVVATVVFAR